MKANNSFEDTGHNRLILVSDIPSGMVTDLMVTVGYTGPSTFFRGIALDQHVIPAIMWGINNYRRPGHEEAKEA